MTKSTPKNHYDINVVAELRNSINLESYTYYTLDEIAVKLSISHETLASLLINYMRDIKVVTDIKSGTQKRVVSYIRKDVKL